MTPHLCEEAERHLRAAGVEGVHVSCGDGWLGRPEAAPFDRILVTASAYDVAPAWFEQLRQGGRLVMPWGAPMAPQRAMAFEKRGGALVLTDSRPCGFMRMRGGWDWQEPQPASGGAQTERWERQLGPGLPPSVEDLIAFPFFLSLFTWPWTPVYLTDEGVTDHTRLHFVNRTRMAWLQMSLGETWTVSGVGDEGIVGVLEDAVRQWFAWGQPAPERLALTGWPRGQAPPLPDGQRLARREWFDYAVEPTRLA